MERRYREGDAGRKDEKEGESGMEWRGRETEKEKVQISLPHSFDNQFWAGDRLGGIYRSNVYRSTKIRVYAAIQPFFFFFFFPQGTN